MSLSSSQNREAYAKVGGDTKGGVMPGASAVAATSSVPLPSAPRRHQKAQCRKCEDIEWRTVRDAPQGQLPTFEHKRCKTRPCTPFTVALEAAKTQCGGL